MDFNSLFILVICYVFIKVKEVFVEVVYNSMVIRFGSILCEGFIIIVMLRFKELVVSIFGIKEENVDFFSVQGVLKIFKVIDVCFVVYGSFYYVLERMIVILKNSRFSLVKVLEVFDVDVLIVGVDECLYEFCELGGCMNILIVNGEVEVIFVKGIFFVLIVVILIV